MSVPTPTSGSTRVFAPSSLSTETSGRSSITSLDVSNSEKAGGSLITSFPSSGSAASSQITVFGGILLGFVSDGRNWVSDVTLPAVKTKAINDIKNLKDNTENVIKNLGGPYPPKSNTCSGGFSRKRFFDPLKAVEGLANDALGLANCVDNIANDLSNEIGPPAGSPLPPDVIDPISTQLSALEKAGQQEKNVRLDQPILQLL